jgi:hypothetical protein
MSTYLDVREKPVANAIARSGFLAGDSDYILLRASMVLIFFSCTSHDRVKATAVTDF